MSLDYPAVCQRFNRWRDLQLLTQARITRLSAEGATLYVRAIVGPRTIVRVKRTSRSWHYKHNDSITLSCNKARTVSLASVLHECAHALNDRKGKLAGAPHGEAFCRTYRRLLREALS